LLPSIADDDLRRFSLGGHSRYLLVETPYHGWPVELHECLYDLRRRGFVPALAHPERNPEVQRLPELLEPFVAGGVLVQLTAASVDGRLGAAPRVTSLALLRRGLVHCIASDAHAASIRAAGLSAAREMIQDARLWNLLVVECPRAILSDEPLPSRP
jgi:protein-tyrosine phosphatase